MGNTRISEKNPDFTISISKQKKYITREIMIKHSKVEYIFIKTQICISAKNQIPKAIYKNSIYLNGRTKA